MVTVFRCGYLSRFDGKLPSLPSTANILIKAFDMRAILVLIIIDFVIWAGIWDGWSFLLAGASCLLMLCFITLPFSTYLVRMLKPKISQAPARRASLLPHRSDQLHPLWLYLDGDAFTLISQWLAR